MGCSSRIPGQALITDEWSLTSDGDRVPEPVTSGLVLLGLLGVAARRKALELKKRRH